MYDEILLPTDGSEAVDIIAACGEEHDLAIETAIRESALRDHHRLRRRERRRSPVMSSHGRSGVSRFVFGSATERIVGLGDRAALVVSQDATDG